jgi:hypothetical protein
MADTRYAGEITSRQIDLSSSPFWSTVWNTTQDGSNGFLQDIVPVRNKNDLLLMYEEHAEDLFVPELEQNAASYEAENDIQKEKKGMTIEELFNQVRENGSYQYFEDHILHTAEDLIARNNGDQIFSTPDKDYNYDLSSRPFWVTTMDSDPSRDDILDQQRAFLGKLINDPERLDYVLNDKDGISKHAIGKDPISINSMDDLIDIYAKFSFSIIDHIENLPLPEKVQEHAASYEAENNTTHKGKNTMSDEANKAAGFEEQPAPEQEAAFGPDEAAEQEAPRETEGLEQEPKERLSPEEWAFRNALSQRKQIAESLKNGSLPCLPGEDGIADTKPAVNLTTGTRYHGANLLYLKDFQKRHGFPTAEYATQDAIQKSGIRIMNGEKGVDINISTKNEQTGEWENKTARLFNVAQTTKPWAFKAYAEKLGQEKEQERQAFLKSQYGDAYQPREKTEQKPGPEITCSSTEPERYLGQYLAAVSLGGTFKATQQQAAEFSQKMESKLYERTLENGNTDPFKLSKICNEAGIKCKEIIKEIKQPQQKQDQTQQHSRHM